jgi:hypothetical protein
MNPSHLLLQQCVILPLLMNSRDGGSVACALIQVYPLRCVGAPIILVQATADLAASRAQPFDNIYPALYAVSGQTVFARSLIDDLDKNAAQVGC